MEVLFQNENVIACIIVFCLMTFDYLSGLFAAIKRKNFKSYKMREGLWHKASVGAILVVCWILNLHWEALGLPNSFAAVLPLAHTAVTLMEIGSIAENLAKINPQLKKLAFWRLFENKEEDKKK